MEKAFTRAFVNHILKCECDTRCFQEGKGTSWHLLQILFIDTQSMSKLKNPTADKTVNVDR